MSITIKKYNLLVVSLIALQLILLIVFAFTRLIDGDEGFYLSAAREVANGQILYQDFFYPQMPYLPYIFSHFSGHGFDTLFFTRLASVAVSVLTTILFYILLCRVTSDRRTILILLTMYLFSGLVISWHSVAKTFAWTDCFLIASFYYLIEFLKNKRMAAIIISGIFIALAVNVRLVLAPVVPLFVLIIIIKHHSDRVKSIAVLLTSFVMASVPSLILLFQDMQRFVFNNIGFHLMRNPGMEFPQTLFSRFLVIGKLLINPQIFILLLILTLALVLKLRDRQQPLHQLAVGSISGLAGMMALLLIAVYLLPDPVHQQYFVQAVPFVLLVAATGLDFLEGRKRRLLSIISNRGLINIAMIIYILGLIPYFVIFIGGVREQDGYAGIKITKQMCVYLNDQADDDCIMAELAYVPLLSDRAVCDGLEFIGYNYDLPIDNNQKRFYHLTNNDDLARILRNREASFYVVRDYPEPVLSEVTDANYSLDTTFGRFKVYRRLP